MVAYGCEMVVAQNCQVVCLRNLIYIWATKVLYVNEAWRWLEAANIKQTQPIVSFFSERVLGKLWFNFKSEGVNYQRFRTSRCHTLGKLNLSTAGGAIFSTGMFRQITKSLKNFKIKCINVIEICLSVYQCDSLFSSLFIFSQICSSIHYNCS